MADFGYDLPDYRDVDPSFGGLADFDMLVDEAHPLGLRMIVNFVPNHTPDEHPWFSESRFSQNMKSSYPVRAANSSCASTRLTSLLWALRVRGTR